MALEQYLYKSVQPCWNCQNATGGCPWADSLEPVPGWEATPVSRPAGSRKGVHRTIESYSIKYCPLYLEDEPREMPVKGMAM